MPRRKTAAQLKQQIERLKLEIEVAELKNKKKKTETKK